MGDNGPKTQATRAEMSAAKLPLAYRDQCAHLLIPLNKCRYDNYYLPWRCSVRSLLFFPVVPSPTNSLVPPKHELDMLCEANLERNGGKNHTKGRDGRETWRN